MATALNFKDIIDVPQWRPASPALAVDAAGMCMDYDMRNNERNVPFNYRLRASTILEAYHAANDEWLTLGSPALAGTFGAGSCCVFHPSQGPRGTLAAGSTTTSIVLSTALPAAVGVNQLANDGSGAGFYIRIIGNATGSSGKTEWKQIVANTAGTTPTIQLDSALSFAPILGDAYEIRAGRLFMLNAGTVGAGSWKYYDVATNSFSGNLTVTNLPATIATDATLVALSESHQPASIQTPGLGFFGQITSTTGNSSTTINSTTGVLPAALKADEYRNFQIRIVNDTTNVTAAGQRRRISTHTAGATATFTVSTAWTVTPSQNAVFVIENDDDKILLFSAAGTSVYNYNIGANTWDTTTWAAMTAARAAGTWAYQSFGIAIDTPRNARHSFIYVARGGAVNTIDVLDIAGAATGAWSNDIAYGNKNQTFGTGTSAAYDPVTLGGKYIYLQQAGTQRFCRFDVLNRVLEPWAYLRIPQGTAVAGAKLHMAYFMDGTTRLSFLYVIRQSSQEQYSVACQR